MSKLSLEEQAQRRRDRQDRKSDPTCCYCGRLMPRLWIAAERLKANPTPGGVRTEPYEPKVGESFEWADRVHVIKAVRRRKRIASWGATHEVWLGGFYNHGEREAPFCRAKCAVSFAVAAVKAGYVMKRSGET